MKRFLKIFIIIVLFGFIPYVSAENFSDFTVTTSFANDIDLTKIPSIYVLISVPGEEDYREIELTRDNMFNYRTKDMPNSDVQFDSAYIAGDRYGKYTLDGKLKRENNNTATLTVSVFLNNGTTTSTTTTTSQTTKGTVTTEVGNSDDIIIIDDNGNVRTTTSSNVSTTKKTEISDAAKARLQLYKYIAIAVVGFILFAIFIILVKVVRTNNLM